MTTTMMMKTTTTTLAVMIMMVLVVLMMMKMVMVTNHPLEVQQGSFTHCMVSRPLPLHPVVQTVGLVAGGGQLHVRCLDRVPVPHVTEQSRQRPQLLQVLVRVSAHKKRGSAEESGVDLVGVWRGQWGGGMGRRDVGLGRVEGGGRRGNGEREEGWMSRGCGEESGVEGWGEGM